jgi:hypothetical protein
MSEIADTASTWMKKRHSRDRFTGLVNDSLKKRLCERIDMGTEYCTVLQAAYIASHFSQYGILPSFKRHHTEMVTLISKKIPEVPQPFVVRFVFDTARVHLSKTACTFRQFIDHTVIAGGTDDDCEGCADGRCCIDFKYARFMTAIQLFAERIIEDDLFLPPDGKTAKQFTRYVIEELRTNAKTLLYYDEDIDKHRVNKTVLRGLAIEASEKLCARGFGRDMCETFIVLLVRSFFTLCLHQKTLHVECENWVLKFFGPI